MDAAEHGKIVLAAVLAGRRDLLDHALRHLGPAHFTDPVQRNLFSMAERYLDQAGGVLTRSALTDGLRSQLPGTALMYGEYFDGVTALHPADEEFRWSCIQLRELASERLTGEALARGMEVLRHGAHEGKRELRGAADARGYVLATFAEIERELHQADAPEGDMRGEAMEMIAEYAERKADLARGGSSGVPTGIPALDRSLGGGLQHGELDIITGYTSAGKSCLCAYVAHSAVLAGKNVIIFTSETLRNQVRIRIAARHTCLEQFGLAGGLNSRDIKAGALKPEHEHVLRAALSDFNTNTAYGHCYVAQVPRGATISTLESRLSRITRMWPADLVIIDYLALLSGDGRRRELREDLSGIIKEAKQLAATHADGSGVPVISPWQINREGRKAAREQGGYTLAALAETAEASSTADVIVSVLEPDEDDSHGRRVPLQLDVLKNRDGERGVRLQLEADFATCTFTSRDGNSQEGLLDYDPGEGGGDFG